ncbi:MAG TPA: ankyrin repeat domain-containing protein, partial [Chthonomonadales bacterium]|nr:ankyrin repeat domain-containing protein [Chthonomonadales bacterium]
MWAVNNRDEATAAKLLDEGVSANLKAPNGDSMLWRAVNNNMPDLAKLLPARGANPNSTGVDGTTPLMMAADYQDPQLHIVHLLLSRGACVNTRDRYRRTALLWALRSGKYAFTVHLMHDSRQILIALLAHGADVHSHDGDGRSVLSYLAGYGETELVREALRHGANPNSAASDGTTPLWWAVGHLGTLQVLLRAGASPNPPNVQPPIINAAYSGDLAALKLLIRFGARVDVLEDGVTRSRLPHSETA